MKTFVYEGIDAESNPVSGEIKAESANDAREKLGAQQIRIRTLAEQTADGTTGDEDLFAGLSPAETTEVQSQVRELIQAELPLAEGLRVAAEEFAEPGLVGWFMAAFSKRGSARVRRALLIIANAVEQGQPIETVMQSRHARNEVGAIMRSGISSEATAMAIGEYSAYARSAMRLRGQVLFLFAYPIVVATLTSVLLGVFFCYAVPEMKQVFDDFGVEVPALTRAVMNLSDALVELGPGIVISAPVLLAASFVGAVLNARWARRLLAWIPLVGSGFRSVDLSRLSHLLAIVLRHRAPVPQALRSGGETVEDKGISSALVTVAEHIESGGTMPRSQAGLSGFPLAFVEAAHQTDDRSTVSDALHSIADMFENRARSIMGMLVAAIQPLILVGLVGTVGVCFVAMILPIIKLLNDLT